MVKRRRQGDKEVVIELGHLLSLCDKDAPGVDHLIGHLAPRMDDALFSEAAERGVLRQYTAWAVALGESRAWADAVEAAADSVPELDSTIDNHIAFALLGNHLGNATERTTTAPASSEGGDWSGGGGFSGSVGGGGGGGGGGSW